MVFIAKLIALLKGFLDLFNWWKRHAAEQEKAQAVERAQERDQAVEDLKKAETDEEMFDAQARIVRNRPR